MKIYVSTYNNYNNGSLQGAWIDLTKFNSKEQFYEYLKKNQEELFGKQWNDDPEYMFQDYEGFPEKLYDEGGIYDGFWELVYAKKDETDEDFEAICDFIQEHGDNFKLPNYEYDLSRAIDTAKEQHRGKWDKLQDYTDQQFDELYLHDVPDSITYYIDYDKYYHTAKHDYWMSDNGNVFECY